ncbi:MAG: class I tRNA ligase family protein, partial [Flavobacteriales bacterium]|nr:class I tRNA ligase family protein [Flavobacteriales bacterium]
VEEVRPHRHSVGHSYRSHVAIEPYLSDQWYVKVTDDRLRGFAQRALASDQRTTDTHKAQKGVEGDGGLRFYPARYAKTYETWHDNLRDWCISRQLWWGHRIPVWHSFQNPEGSIGNEDSKLHPFLQDGRMSGQLFGDRTFICIRDEDDFEAIKAIEDAGWKQDPDVLDTWFSSALWPL